MVRVPTTRPVAPPRLPSETTPPSPDQVVPDIRTQGAWVQVITARPHPRLRLIVFPYAGGGPRMALGWGDFLPRDVEVIAVQLPGRGVRLAEPALDSVVDMAEGVSTALRDELLEPYALYGHSLGALVAFEVARRAAWQGDPPPVHLFAGACRAPQLPRTTPALHELPESELLGELANLGGTPAEVLADSDLMAAMLPTLRADFRAGETYRYRPGPKLACPITAIGGSNDHTVSPADLDAWRAQTDAEFRRVELDGDHFFVDNRRTELLAVLRDELDRPG